MGNLFDVGRGLSTHKKGDAGISIKVSIPLKQASLFLILPNLWFGAMTWRDFI